MRIIVLGVSTLLTLLYVRGAVYFYQQERWAQTPELAVVDPSALHHPEATLGMIHRAFGLNNFSDEVLACVDLSLQQIPSFYQPPFLLATYHASRVEEPERIRRGYEAALRRYGSNGRLHLAYAQWLLTSRRHVIGGGAGGSDAVQLAEDHVKTALRFEPELTGAALGLLQNNGVPPERWSRLIPTTLPEQRQLVSALARAGHRTEALERLRNLLEENSEVGLLRDASQWALLWGDPELSLESARRWQEAASNQTLDELGRAALQVARVHLRRGETEAAYQAFRDALLEIQRRSSESSAAAMELLCGVAYEYLQGGHGVIAESLFGEAATLSPSYVPASLGLARTYRQSGDKAAAIEVYQKVLQLDPENTEAEKELAPLIMERELEGQSY